MIAVNVARSAPTSTKLGANLPIFFSALKVMPSLAAQSLGLVVVIQFERSNCFPFDVGDSWAVRKSPYPDPTYRSSASNDHVVDSRVYSKQTSQPVRTEERCIVVERWAVVQPVEVR